MSDHDVGIDPFATCALIVVAGNATSKCDSCEHAVTAGCCAPTQDPKRQAIRKQRRITALFLAIW